MYSAGKAEHGSCGRAECIEWWLRANLSSVFLPAAPTGFDVKLFDVKLKFMIERY